MKYFIIVNGSDQKRCFFNLSSPPQNTSQFPLEDDVNHLEITNHDRTDMDEDDELTEEIVET